MTDEKKLLLRDKINYIGTIVLAVFACIGFLGVAGPMGLFGGEQNAAAYTRPEYAAPKGDCFVPPSGDPLWDAHYAEKVNLYNCEAFKDQAAAKAIPNINTLASKFVWLILGGLALIFGGALYLITH